MTESGGFAHFRPDSGLLPHNSPTPRHTLRDRGQLRGYGGPPYTVTPYRDLRPRYAPRLKASGPRIEEIRKVIGRRNYLLAKKKTASLPLANLAGRRRLPPN